MKVRADQIKVGMRHPEWGEVTELRTVTDRYEPSYVLVSFGSESFKTPLDVEWDLLPAAPRLIKIIERQTAAITRVRELHSALPRRRGGTPTCADCNTWWPCLTIRALDGGDA
jgi:hypothetical protein